MKVKTINKVIKSKLKKWIASIKDVQLAADLRDNIIVTGGCIASMLLNEDVNDYDIYIDDIEVLERLCKYYAIGITVYNGTKREIYLKQYDFVDVFGKMLHDTDDLKEGEDYDAYEYVAAYNLNPDQVKILVVPGGKRFDYNDPIKEDEYKVLFISPNAITLSNKIQIVTRFSGDCKNIHKNFDFIHATNYWTFKDGLVVNPNALTSLLTKELKYSGSLYPVTSIFRMKKFVLRGYTINAGEMLKIIFQVSQLDLTNMKVLEEQLTGVDIAYFSQLISILKGVDVKKITPSYMNTIIDKVFNEYNADDEDEN